MVGFDAATAAAMAVVKLGSATRAAATECSDSGAKAGCAARVALGCWADCSTLSTLALCTSNRSCVAGCTTSTPHES